ncbi:MAG TPA: DUF2339 domain-containing protein [Candidatus Binatia bacterium]|jgi:hypothetical protein|nr:DUF2339 domain-containing protein [Candidatus Binatia bacterium]
MVREHALSLIGLIAIVLAIIALRRSGRDAALEERVTRLEAELQALRGRSPIEAVVAGLQVAEPALEPEATVAPKAPVTPVEPPPAPGAWVASEPPPPLPEPEPAAPPVKIDWERWIGVRGAAVLGGIVLAMAGLFFFRYSIEHGLFPPWLRVVLGTLAGIACLVGSELVMRRRYAGTADAVAGAGIVILYAAFWAAANLYDLIGTGTLFVLLVAVTATGGTLSWRHGSLLIAVLGLIGGFLTPIFASRNSDNPIGLFSYLLLLDVALLTLARKRQWPVLGLLALAATTAYQFFWVTFGMGPERSILGLVILGAFAGVFALGGPRREGSTRTWVVTQAAGVLLPFACALQFAFNADLGDRLVPLSLLLAVLSFAAAWLSRQHREPLLGVGAASATVAVLSVWMSEHATTPAVAWQASIAVTVLAGIFHLFVERDPDASGWQGPATTGLLSATGFFVLLVVSAVAGPGDVGLWPWLAGWSALAAILLRHGGLPDRERLQLVAAMGIAIGLGSFRAVHRFADGFPSQAAYLAITLTVAVAFQVTAMLRAPGRPREFGEQAAALVAVASMLLVITPMSDATMVALGAATALGLLATLAATRLGGSWWGLVAMLATAFVHTSWAMDRVEPSTTGFVMQAMTVVVLTLWPFLAVDRLRGNRWAWWTAALAGPAWFVSLGQQFTALFGDSAIGILPLGLGAVTLAAAQRARAVFAEGDPARVSNLAWFLGITTAFVTVAIPLQLDREWITIGWALEGVALVTLWQRLDHPGLKYVGLALLGTVAVRLVANEAVLTYHARPAWRIVNWLLYTYLVPAAAMFRAAAILAPIEVPRLRDWERPVYPGERAVGSMAAGLAGLVIVFAWLNIAIVEWFAQGPDLTLDFARMPARDLTTSIVWALYALGLLALGVRLTSVGLRWVSLVLMMITIAKVFLYDVGELTDLYRVASLLGLALSLIGVSLAYQRFVLRREPSEP